VEPFPLPKLVYKIAVQLGLGSMRECWHALQELIPGENFAVLFTLGSVQCVLYCMLRLVEPFGGGSRRSQEGHGRTHALLLDGMKFQAGPVSSAPPGSRTAGAAGLAGGSSSRGGQQGGTGGGRGGVGASGADSFDTLPVFDAAAATSSPVLGPSSDFAQAAASAADASMFTFGDEEDDVDFDGF